MSGGSDGPGIIVTTGGFKRSRAFGAGVGGTDSGVPARFCDWLSGGWLLALPLFLRIAGVVDRERGGGVVGGMLVGFRPLRPLAKLHLTFFWWHLTHAFQ